MKCPHCMTGLHNKPDTTPLGQDATHGWALISRLCPECNKFNFSLATAEYFDKHLMGISAERLVYPKGAQRSPPSPAVPAVYADDYVEACLVLPDSAKASAALSRRCLQAVLRHKAGITPGDLSKEIQQVLDSKALPSYLAESIDAVRHIGNFAAHPIKDTSSGVVVPVEPGEAEWTLDVLEGLFDFYFVQPALLKQKRDALNAKLATAGKKPMK
jgi:hypothetical protein